MDIEFLYKIILIFPLMVKIVYFLNLIVNLRDTFKLI